VPFADPEIFFEATGLYVDEKVSVIPDFAAYCGMARVFAYFMEREVSMHDTVILKIHQKPFSMPWKKQENRTQLKPALHN
jgi:hypothetical protein